MRILPVYSEKIPIGLNRLFDCKWAKVTMPTTYRIPKPHEYGVGETAESPKVAPNGDPTSLPSLNHHATRYTLCTMYPPAPAHSPPSWLEGVAVWLVHSAIPRSAAAAPSCPAAPCPAAPCPAALTHSSCASLRCEYWTEPYLRPTYTPTLQLCGAAVRKVACQAQGDGATLAALLLRKLRGGTQPRDLAPTFHHVED